MDLTSLLIGAAIGLVLAYILFYLLHKSNSVPKQEYDTLPPNSMTLFPPLN